MRLDVGLVDDQQAVFVAEFVPAVVVRIVAGADGVEVELLHRLDVEAHILLGHGERVLRADVVTVHAAHDEALAVQEDGPVADFDLAESDRHILDFQRLAGIIHEVQEEFVEIRGIRGPLFGSGHMHGNDRRAAFRPLTEHAGLPAEAFRTAFGDKLAVCIQQTSLHANAGIR